MAQLTGHVPAVPRSWPLPPRREALAAGGAGDSAMGRSSPTTGQGRASFADVVAAFNTDDLVAHRVGEGVDPPATQRMAFWRWVEADGVEKLLALSPAIGRAVSRAEDAFFAARRAAAAARSGPCDPPEVYDIATPPDGASRSASPGPAPAA
eukprot:2774064-Alexandrium_andersonii.AAC.1